MHNSDKPIVYPTSRTVDQIDDYHGIQVKDPYRWLEDLESDETKAWVEAQNQVTHDYLSQIPIREQIKQRLTQLWNYEKFDIPFKAGQRYFYFKNDGLQNQSVLYTLTSVDAEPKVLLDPNQLSEDGTVALTNLEVSPDGKLMAYGLSTSGSDWQEWKVRDIETGEDLGDHLEWIKSSEASWTQDSQGFFYSHYYEPDEKGKFEEPNYFQRLFYHKLGQPQSEDALIYESPTKKEWNFRGDVTADGRYLIITVESGTDLKNLILYKDLTNPNAQVGQLISEFQASYNFIANHDSVFWFQTDLNAPRYRVIAIDTKNPAPDQWQEMIPQAGETLQSATVLNNLFVANYLKDACTQIKIFDLFGAFVREVALPGIGTVSGFGSVLEGTETFYSFTNFTTPPTIYYYDMVSGESKVFRQPQLNFNPDDYETKQVFYSSKDGTSVPMFISHKKGIKLAGNHPTYLYGFGGFGTCITPNFYPGGLIWMEMGGVFVMPNLRGGGEYGEEWHQAGTKLKKQNVFDDCIAASEWLIAHKYTSSAKLVLGGGSNGGLLVGACMTQGPDLFAVALPTVGVMDMLRYEQFTVGWGWTSDYGSPENPEEFKAIYAYSPLHNIKPGTSYPATLIITGDHDDQVIPAHSFKFAAALQAAHAGKAPILILIQKKEGHGPGKPTTKRIEETADQWAFVMQNLATENSA